MARFASASGQWPCLQPAPRPFAALSHPPDSMRRFLPLAFLLVLAACDSAAPGPTLPPGTDPPPVASVAGYPVVVDSLWGFMDASGRLIGAPDHHRDAEHARRRQRTSTLLTFSRSPGNKA